MTENDAIEELKFNNEKCLEQCEGACFSRKNNDCACQDAVIERMLDELLQYRAIGTAEECREAVDKQKLKKPRDIEYDYSYFVCPNCGEGIYVSEDFESHKFCLNCGQAIQWNENLKEMDNGT